MNWGTNIFLSLALFVIGIIGAGVYMMSHDSDSLEDDDYYEKGLNYDEAFDKKQNVLNLNATPKIKISQDTLYIQFVSKINKGKLLLKKPSNNQLDKELLFQTSNNLYTLPISSLGKGVWNLHIDWQSDGKGLLVEKRIVF